MSGALARTLAFALGVVALSHSAFAQDLPALTQPVNDFANVIDPATEATLDALIRRLRDASGDAVVVATVPSMAPYTSIEEYALRLFEKAGIGDKDKANGLLVVLAVGERRVRVEVGYGLEEFITDGFAGETIRQQMLPAFREGRYGAGLSTGTTRIVSRIVEGRRITLEGLPAANAAPGPRPSIRLGDLAVTVFVLLIIVLALRSKGPPRSGGGRRRGTWSGWHGGVGGFGGGFGGFGGGFGGGFSGGSGGGGFGGFGGGRSGGGGASGGW